MFLPFLGISSVVNGILGGIYKSVIIRIIYAKIFNDKNLTVNMTVDINSINR